MCGIAGFTYPRGTLSASEAERAALEMIRRLVHRGPDAFGIWGREGVVLGHRRLSIIDLSGGAQPMMDPDSGCCITFNGEIYNFKEINRELESFGATFRTSSDTETILKAYAAWGEDCLVHFNGMFAFVLYDPAARKLFGARDRMGKKPFYYHHDGQTFIFGSEPKALLVHPSVPHEIDWEAAARYFLYEYVPAPHAIYRGMRKLPAGYKFSFDLNQGTLSLDQYWDCHFGSDASAGDAESEEFWVARLREELNAAVRRRLISDVPLGAFLSGGVDSSAVVAAMVAQQGSEKVKTFSIAFTDPTYDESKYANFVAQTLGTEHHEILLDADHSVDILPILEMFLDEPMADPSIIPTYLVSRFARHHVTVALGGDGGDELFAGYDTFRALAAAGFYNRAVPSFLDRGFRRAVGRIPVRASNFSFDFVARQFLRGVKVPEAERLWRWLGAFNLEELSALFTPDVLEQVNLPAIVEEVHGLYDKVSSQDAVARDIYGYMKTYLQDDILTKVDRATMACSMEARSPLLDVNLVDLANSIPSRWKRTRTNRLKYIFKTALRGIVPDTILNRKKKGFGVPLASWFRGPLREPLWDGLSESRLRRQGIFRPETVRLLLEEHESGRANHRKPLWSLFIFQRWFDNWAKDGDSHSNHQVPLVVDSAAGL